MGWSGLEGPKSPKRRNPYSLSTPSKTIKTQKVGSVHSIVSNITPSQAAQNFAQRNFQGSALQNGAPGWQKRQLEGEMNFSVWSHLRKS